MLNIFFNTNKCLFYKIKEFKKNANTARTVYNKPICIMLYFNRVDAKTKLL